MYIFEISEVISVCLVLSLILISNSSSSFLSSDLSVLGFKTFSSTLYFSIKEVSDKSTSPLLLSLILILIPKSVSLGWMAGILIVASSA